MTTTFSGGSATIYTFPPRGRFAVSNQHDQSSFATNVQLPRGMRIASGSSWYHEEAIQSEQRRDS
jgi:Protein of unknown function (DUF2735)